MLLRYCAALRSKLFPEKEESSTKYALQLLRLLYIVALVFVYRPSHADATLITFDDRPTEWNIRNEYCPDDTCQNISDVTNYLAQAVITNQYKDKGVVFLDSSVPYWPSPNPSDCVENAVEFSEMRFYGNFYFVKSPSDVFYYITTAGDSETILRPTSNVLMPWAWYSWDGSSMPWHYYMSFNFVNPTTGKGEYAKNISFDLYEGFFYLVDYPINIWYTTKNGGSTIHYDSTPFSPIHVTIKEASSVFISSGSSFMLEGYALDNLKFTLENSLTLQGELLKTDGTPDSAIQSKDVPSSNTINATIPLGARFVFNLENPADSTQVTSTYALSDANIDPSIDSDALFANDNIIEFDSSSASDKKYFQAVHLGKETLTITPSDTSLSPVTVNITVDKPASLGSNHNQYDSALINLGNKRGIPPQFIKGHIVHESDFDPKDYRYEPLSNDSRYISSIGDDLRIMTPYSWFVLATSDGIPQGEFVSEDDISPRDIYWIIVDGAAHKINDTDTFVTADNIYNNNDEYEHWGRASPRVAERVDSDPTALLFTAQTPVAASYGLLQILYTTAIAPMNWKGVGGDMNPHYLFDTGENVANGGGSLNLGTGYLVLQFRAANPTADGGNSEYASPSEFVDAFKNAFNYYNCGRDVCPRAYGNGVISDAAAFSPVPSTSIFQ